MFRFDPNALAIKMFRFDPNALAIKMFRFDPNAPFTPMPLLMTPMPLLTMPLFSRLRWDSYARLKYGDVLHV
jgi:hypothetical protein